MAKVPNGVKTLPKISIAWVGCTNVSDDRRQTDARRHIANLNLSSRSLKTVNRIRNRISGTSLICSAAMCHSIPLHATVVLIVLLQNEIGQCIDNDSTHFHDPLFWGRIVTPFSQRWETELCQILRGHRPIIGDPGVCFRFHIKYIATFLNAGKSNGTAGSKL